MTTTHDAQGGAMSTQPSEKEKLELALSFGMDPDTAGPLSDERRAEIERQLAGLSGTPAPDRAPEPEGAHQVASIQEMIQREIAKMGLPTQQPASLEDVLKQIDPRDSEAALVMLDWLQQTGRLQAIGSLNGGGYLWHYSEPKGATKQGYTPGGTQGGRMVDQAVDQARASGAKPRQLGLCDKCWSAVERQDDGTVVTDDEAKSAVCSTGGQHTFNA